MEKEELAKLKPIHLSIKYDDIDTSKLYPGKNDRYLNVVIIPTPGNQYNQFMVCQSTTKEERDKGIKGAILGNANFSDKDRGRSGSQAAPKPAAVAPKPAPKPAVVHGDGIDDSVPF